MKLLISVLVSLLASTAMAGEFLLLEMGDAHLKSNQGNDTIRLKRELRSEYPGMNFRKMKIMSVVMVAKTRAGKGNARLVVGPDQTAPQVVGGSKAVWNKTTQDSYDRVLFENPAGESKGKWQIHLKGNFKIHQILVEVDPDSLESFSLDYTGTHIRTGKGDDGILKLKRAAKNQHGLIPRDYELVSVELVAKSKHGGGKATLFVGGQTSAQQTIAGTPQGFKKAGAFDRMVFENPKADSSGAWQIHLKGNIKVKEVILNVREK